MPEPQDIGAVLKRLREKAGLSQRDLAARLGIHQPAVARWEAGGVRLPINRIEEIVAELGYGVEYDLAAVPVGEALNDGVSLTLVRRRPDLKGASSELLRLRSGAYDFSVNRESPWNVDMWLLETGRRLPGAYAVYPERIEALAAHPDGVLIRFGRTVGKITPSTKTRDDGSVVFTYAVANGKDLELAGVADDPDWQLLQ
jgi:transcriptional regulator with XRE-family HTH domain